MTDQEEYETHDIYLAAFLLQAGCELKRRRRQGPRVYFVFTNIGGSIKDLRDSFYSNRATVKAHDFSQKIMAVKELLYE